MRVLVTGAGGFLGGAVVERLQAVGGIEVVPLVRRTRGGANEVVADLTDPLLRERLPSRIDMIVHAGAYVPEKEANAETELSMATNAEATLRLLEYSAAAGAARFVYVSSAAVYGATTCQNAVAESVEPSPDNPYALSKLAGEVMLEAYRFVHRVETVGLRYSYIYGRGMRVSSVVHKFSVLAGSNAVLPLYNSGADYFDLIHVSDAVRAVESAMRLGSGIFNIGSGKPTSVLDLARTMIEARGSSSRIERLPSKGAYRSKYLDISKAAAELEWAPRVALAEGLRTL